MQTDVQTAVGCDIGGTSCKIGLVNRVGESLEHRAFPISSSITLEDFREELFDAIDTLTHGQTISGIGILVPGYLNKNRTAARIAVNLRVLEGAPLVQWVRARYGVDAIMEIDRNAPAFAEYVFYYRERVSRLLYVTIGTGLGGGLVIDGEICRVCNGSVGELGHITLNPEGIRCSCGNIGCAETLISRDGIGRIAEGLGLARRSDKTLLQPNFQRRSTMKRLPAMLRRAECLPNLAEFSVKPW